MLIGALLGVLGWSLPAAASGPGGSDGVEFVRNATSASSQWLEGVNRDASHRKWIRNHYSGVRGYAPYFTNQSFHDNPKWEPPRAQLYTDLYIMGQSDPAQFRLMNDANPSQPVYVDASCSPGCPAFAGDTGDPAYRQWWIQQARKHLNDGYEAIFIDDSNMELRRFEDAGGNTAFARDPRTGQAMTQERSRLYTAEFVEAIDRAFPNKEIIANNNQFWVGKDKEGANRRTIQASDVTELERGFGATLPGAGPYGYVTLLRHVQWIHDLGGSVLLEPYVTDSTPWKAELELASYFLIKARQDAIASTYRADRGNWWPGWETSLGEPKNRRSRWKGLFRRDFKRGLALVNQPGEPTRTAGLPSGATWKDLDGNIVTEVTLAGGTGKVLRKR